MNTELQWLWSWGRCLAKSRADLSQHGRIMPVGWALTHPRATQNYWRIGSLLGFTKYGWTEATPGKAGPKQGKHVTRKGKSYWLFNVNRSMPLQFRSVCSRMSVQALAFPSVLAPESLAGGFQEGCPVSQQKFKEYGDVIEHKVL